MGSLPTTFCLVLLLLPLAASPQTAKEPGELLEERGWAALSQRRYRDALVAFDELLSREPDRASAHYGKGLAFTGILNYSAAAGSFEKAVALKPDLADAWRRLVVLYSQLQRDPSTKRAYEKARRLAKVPEEDRLSLARALRKTDWITEARALLHEAQPLGVNEHFELGLLALEEDDTAGAAGHLQAATSDPSRSTADAEYQYGRTLEALGHTEQAIEHYRRAMSKDPRMGSARFRLGNLLLRSGSPEQGRALLHGYEQFRQWDRRVKLLLAMVTSGMLSEVVEREKTRELVNLLLQGGALEDAAALIDSALAKNPEDPAFLVAQARWLLSSGQPDKARALVERLLSFPDPPPEARWLSARLHILQGESPEAIESFHRLLGIDPDPPAALLKELATAYAMNAQTDEAASYYQRALAKDPLLAGAHAGLGSLLESAGSLEEAERRYRRALEINPDLLSAQQLLAELLLRRGDAEEGADLLRRSVTTNPTDALLRRNLAQALQRLGKEKEAEAELEKARQIEAWKSPRTK